MLEVPALSIAVAKRRILNQKEVLDFTVMTLFPVSLPYSI